ncbi:MAG: glycerol-3-phosphate dehydrogenase, partial [Hyphomicrobiales bacterium]|nr:glycerol-3-phosphate dehydrogenase [Hyphomicrobiales bacterium]
QEATRDYVLKLDKPDGKAPLLSVFGGKITTYRRLAEAVLYRLKPYFPSLSAHIGWTAQDCLPGGDFPETGFMALVDGLSADYPEFDRAYLTRLSRLYGTCALKILGSAKSMADLGQHFGGTLTAREIDYLISSEWAKTADDILWRRTKLGLVLTEAERLEVLEFIEKFKSK